MELSRREFLHLLGIASAVGAAPFNATAGLESSEYLYTLPLKGNVRLLHFTDSHAQLLPVYFREPSVNIGVGDNRGKAPHLVGRHFLQRFGLASGSRLAHAFTCLDFESAAQTYGKVGGFAHLATLIRQLRNQAGEQNCLLLDGGDTWQGSGTAYRTQGMDMVGASNLLGVDVMTGHWEFTYEDEQVLKNIQASDAQFVAQNVRATEDALFEGTHVHNEDSGHVFPPYVIKQVAVARVAIVGQAFPYTPIANPSRFIPDWTFGIRESELQQLVNDIRAREKPDALVLLSHNRMDVDLKLASAVSGIDVILGGHTHDGVPEAIKVSNSMGITLVTNAGSNGKFLGVMDLDIRRGRVRDFNYKLLRYSPDCWKRTGKCLPT